MEEMEVSTAQARGLAVGGTTDPMASASSVQRSQGMSESRKQCRSKARLGIGGRLLVSVFVGLLGLMCHSRMMLSKDTPASRSSRTPPRA
eukprot:8070566-Heterocapsa_arctica.AAC.1